MLRCCCYVMILMQEVGSGNTSQKSDEEDFVKVDDLPLQLTVMCEVCNMEPMESKCIPVFFLSF